MKKNMDNNKNNKFDEVFIKYIKEGIKEGGT